MPAESWAFGGKIERGIGKGKEKDVLMHWAPWASYKMNKKKENPVMG